MNRSLNEIDVDLEHHRHKPENGGDGRQEYGAQTLHARLYDGLHWIFDVVLEPVICIDKDDIVIHHDAGQRNHSDSGHDDSERLLKEQ